MSKGRNVTTDNFFTSFLLAKELKKKTNLVDCLHLQKLRASEKCLQQRYSSKLMKAGDMETVTVYQCKLKKNVCVLSSLRMPLELGESRKKKSETVKFYNKTKCAVDVADQIFGQVVSSQSRHPSVARCCFLQHSEFGRHQCICAL